MSFLTRILLCLLLSLGAYSFAAVAEEKVTPLEAAQSIYHNIEEMLKVEFNAKVKDWSDGFEKAIGVPYTTQNLITAKRLAAQSQYQQLIDYVLCTERGTPGEFCYGELNEYTVEMLKFTTVYDHLDGHGLNITICKAKTRLFQVETRYAPYDWMIIDRIAPGAYDSKAFLECVRKSQSP